jgi:hypothetical protein
VAEDEARKKTSNRMESKCIQEKREWEINAERKRLKTRPD